MVTSREVPKTQNEKVKEKRDESLEIPRKTNSETREEIHIFLIKAQCEKQMETLMVEEQSTEPAETLFFGLFKTQRSHMETFDKSQRDKREAHS